MSCQGLRLPAEAVRGQSAKRTRTTRLVGPHSGMTRDDTGPFLYRERTEKVPGLCPGMFVPLWNLSTHLRLGGYSGVIHFRGNAVWI